MNENKNNLYDKLIKYGVSEQTTIDLCNCFDAKTIKEFVKYLKHERK